MCILLQPVPSQKLIYRGQLLQGSQQLSDIVSDTDVSLCEWAVNCVVCLSVCVCVHLYTSAYF